MPPKRRGAQAKSAPPPPPPPPPPETDATKVRREWSKFIDAWYEPQKKKFVEKLQKDILVKYKSLGSAKETQKLREMELFEKLDSIARQLAQPARTEWERRLDLAQLREDQWDDMSAEEQQAVMSVFIGFVDDVEDLNDDDDDLNNNNDNDPSPHPLSIDEPEPVPEDHSYRSFSSHPGPVISHPPRQPVPPTPTRQTFEFVNPTSFSDAITPPIPPKNLPALSMDHLVTLGPSNAARSAEPVSAGIGSIPGFQNWASEAGIITQQPQPAKPTPTSASSLSARPRPAEIISRQTSAASTSSPQYSPPDQTTKFSPAINADNLPLGKRYIGPVILEEEPNPLDEELLKSKMADEYQQYKVSLRIQMIYQFHAEAAEFEIKLFETLLADDGTKESRTRAVQEHETSMMRLREQKEEDRKRLCAEERERRRGEMRLHLAQRRPPQHREPDPALKTNPPPNQSSDKIAASAQQRSGRSVHQKENVPLPQSAPAAAPSTLEPPGIIKKSISTLSQDEASANEALFANAMAKMTQGKNGLTPAQASLNEALFSNAAATFAAQGPSGNGAKSTLQPPSIMKKSNSSRSQDHDVPQITVSFAEPPAIAIPELAQAPLPAPAVKGKKGKKGPPQPAPQQPTPPKPVAVTVEPEVGMEAEPPPPVSSLWDTARNVWDVASATISPPKVKVNVTVEEERDPEPVPAPPKGNASTKKAVSAAKKGKKVTIIEEPDVDADPIVSPPPSAKTKATKGAWGSVNAKSKATPAVIVEGSEAEPSFPTPVRGKKAAEAAAGARSGQKPHLKVTIADEQESGSEASPAPAWTNKTKSAWGVPAVTPGAGTSTSTSMQAGQKAAQLQAMPRHDAAASDPKFARMDAVLGPEGTGVGEGTMPGALGSVGSKEVEDDDDDEADASSWFKPENISYWANFMAGQPEVETQAVSPVAPPTSEQVGKHVLWTPTVGEESDDEEGDAELATSMWMQYAISGGDMLGGAPEEPPVGPSDIAQHETSIWEQGKVKKVNGDLGNRAQQTSAFDRAALAGQWPKMESWLSPPSRGQSSGSTRVF